MQMWDACCYGKHVNTVKNMATAKEMTSLPGHSCDTERVRERERKRDRKRQLSSAVVYQTNR